ncbi:Pepco domain-containing protein [Streptomyces chartreusis]
MSLGSQGQIEGLEVLVKVGPEDVTQEGAPFSGSKGLRRQGSTSDFTAVTLSSERLRDSIESTVGALRDIFDRVAESSGRFPLKEVQLSFEISAKGGIRLIGTSEVEGKGGMTLIFGTRDSEG